MSADPTPVIVESTYLRANGGPDNETSWDVPLEMVLHCSSSVFKKTVFDRAEKGDKADPTCRVFLRGERLFGIVRYPEPRPWLLFPLDCWPMRGAGWYRPSEPEARP